MTAFAYNVAMVLIDDPDKRALGGAIVASVSGQAADLAYWERAPVWSGYRVMHTGARAQDVAGIPLLLRQLAPEDPTLGAPPAEPSIEIARVGGGGAIVAAYWIFDAPDPADRDARIASRQAVRAWWASLGITEPVLSDA